MESQNIKYGQVWLCENSEYKEGSLQRKTRPVVIVSNNLNNKYSPNVNIVPITSARKVIRGPYQVQFYWSPYSSNKNIQTILCEQVNTVPKAKLLKYLYTLDSEVIFKVKNSLKVQLNLQRSNNYGNF